MQKKSMNAVMGQLNVSEDECISARCHCLHPEKITSYERTNVGAFSGSLAGLHRAHSHRDPAGYYRPDNTILA